MTFSNDDLSVKSKTTTAPCEYLKFFIDTDLNLSWPAVSHNFNFNSSPDSIFIDFVIFSMPTVVKCSSLNSNPRNVEQIHVFPTAVSPKIDIDIAVLLTSSCIYIYFKINYLEEINF